MSDISKCYAVISVKDGEVCPLAKKCYRHTVRAGGMSFDCYLEPEWDGEVCDNLVMSTSS